MLRLPQFSYLVPKTLEEAVDMLRDEPHATRIVAGGTDLWPNMKRRHQQADRVVTLGRLEDLKGISGDPTREITIGAMTTLTQVAKHPTIVEHYPMVARAILSISSPVLRNMGTIGGNLCLDTRCTYYDQSEEWRQSIDYCMKEAGKTCWVAPSSPRCWAISASDSAPLLSALRARVKLVSVRGERVIEARDLYQDDGIAYLTKARDEILTAILLPAADAFESSFWKLRRRGSIDFSVLTAAPALKRDAQGTVTEAHVHLGAVASFPVECGAANDVLLGKQLTEDVIREAARAAKRDANPLDNTDFTLQWRAKMVERYVEAALREIAGQDPGRRAPRHLM